MLSRGLGSWQQKAREYLPKVRSKRELTVPRVLEPRVWPWVSMWDLVLCLPWCESASASPPRSCAEWSPFAGPCKGVCLTSWKWTSVLVPELRYHPPPCTYVHVCGKSAAHEWNPASAQFSVTQSSLTLCEPRDYNPPGFSAHGIFQERIQEWDAISFSRVVSWLDPGYRPWLLNACMLTCTHCGLCPHLSPWSPTC